MTANPNLTTMQDGSQDAAPVPVSEVLAPCRRAMVGLALMSGVINILYLTGSFFMLEVYDRVLPSRSVPTLLALGIIVLVLYVFQGLLDVIRGRIFVRIGAYLDEGLSSRIYDCFIQLSLKRAKTDPLQPSRDLDQVRQFLWSGGPVAFLDLPWMPIYLFICFMFHFWLGVAAVAGAVILMVVTWLTEKGSQEAAKAAHSHFAKRALIGEESRRNAEVIQALGMSTAVGHRWSEANKNYLAMSSRTSDVVLGFGSVSKVVRTALQSFVLALGAWLVINQEATAGIMIASSILVSRALAPIEMVIGQWKGVVAARQSWKRLNDTLLAMPVKRPMQLPAPTKSFVVDNVTLVPPGSTTPNVFDVSLRLTPGSALGIIGASASGKSSVVRGLVGLWPAARGTIRLDGAALDQWVPQRLGQHIGYMPQDVELFAATIAQNISRFQPNADPAAIIEAAKAADVHQMILQMPNGYDTMIGDQGSLLSAGQRQRIALARALYGNPFLVILDEPNSNLDTDGEAALTQAILRVRARGGIAIIVAHRPSAIASCNLLLMMAGGRCQMFGTKEEVLAAVTKPVAPPTNVHVLGA